MASLNDHMLIYFISWLTHFTSHRPINLPHLISKERKERCGKLVGHSFSEAPYGRYKLLSWTMMKSDKEYEETNEGSSSTLFFTLMFIIENEKKEGKKVSFSFQTRSSSHSPFCRFLYEEWKKERR